MKPAMTPQQAALTAESCSPLSLYRQLAVGERSFFDLIYYEANTLLLSGLPGLLGLASRALFYPAMFAACASRPAFGRGITIRQPGKISIGKKLLADDYCVLDVRGKGGSISLGDFVSIGRFSTITAKEGSVDIASGVNIGSYARIATQSKVTIAESVLIAAYCYIGPGNHAAHESDQPLISQAMEIRGGVSIGAHAWIGAHSTILDGVTIGENAIIGAHSLVRESVPANAIAVGSPARVIKMRAHNSM
jgi:acetyltransferase-like isoleucine patch superfamily enzyme